MLTWKIKQYHLGHRNVFIGLYHVKTKKWVYQFKFTNQLPKKVDEISDIFELSDEIIDFFG